MERHTHTDRLTDRQTEGDRETGRRTERDKIILYYTMIKIYERFDFFANLSLMTNTATHNT